MNEWLDLLLDVVRESGGNGKIYKCEWLDVLPENKSAEIAIFFLNLQRVYIASLSKESYVVSAVINQPNRFGGAISAFGHYCFQEPDAEVLQRLDEFYEKMRDTEFFDFQEEIRVNKDIDFIIHNIACELGYAI